MMLTSKTAVGTKQGEKQLDEMNSGMDYLEGKSPNISKSVSERENKTKVIKISNGSGDMLKVLRNQHAHKKLPKTHITSSSKAKPSLTLSTGSDSTGE